MSTAAVAPALSAMRVAVSTMRRWASSRFCGSSVRRVPASSTCSGMMLVRTPPWNMLTVMTLGPRVTSSCRATMAFSPCTISAPTVIGSMPFHGWAPWVCLPATTMWKVSFAASAPPAR